MSRASTDGTPKLQTVELTSGTVIHYSALEGGVSFVCRRERQRGDFWSLYQDHVTCPMCREWIASEGHPK
jgi:hypothetical protein